MKQPTEAPLWAVFSSGGMLAALFLPALALVSFLAAPLGWFGTIDHATLFGLYGHPVTRALLFVLVSLSFFHAAHRFRYTLYDGMQLYHLNALIAVLTYGLATLLTLLAAVVLWVVG